MTPPRLPDVFARSARIVGRRIAGEMVLVPLVSHGADLDAIYNLNAVGAFIWERLDGQASGQAIVAVLTDAFEVTADRAEADYLEFLGRLQDLGAVEPVKP